MSHTHIGEFSGVSVSVFDVGIGIRYFAIIYNFWCNTATAMSVGSFHVHRARRPLMNQITSDAIN